MVTGDGVWIAHGKSFRKDGLSTLGAASLLLLSPRLLVIAGRPCASNTKFSNAPLFGEIADPE
jgi:hypothetical protein